MGVGGQHHASAALPLGKRISAHCVGAWVGPRAGLEGPGKFAPPPPTHPLGFGPRTVQPVASSYSGRRWIADFGKIRAPRALFIVMCEPSSSMLVGQRFGL